MDKQRGNSGQLKGAGLQPKTAFRRRTRGSRGDTSSDTPVASGSSVQTPIWGRGEDVSGGMGGGDGGIVAGEGATSRRHIPEYGICTPSSDEESVEERATTHKHATTSWRCGFEWVSALLEKRLKAWDDEDVRDCQCSVDDLYNEPFSFKYVCVDSSDAPRIIGRGGRVIRQMEQTFGVFLTLTKLRDGSHEMSIIGPRRSCILTEFAIELLSARQHSALATLSSLSL